MQQVDLLVVPSLVNEGLGVVVLEAKRAGIPAIVFPSGGLQETVRTDVDGYVCPSKSAADLEAAIRKVVGDQNRRQRWASAAAESYARFDASTMLDQWEQVLQQ